MAQTVLFQTVQVESGKAEHVGVHTDCSGSGGSRRPFPALTLSSVPGERAQSAVQGHSGGGTAHSSTVQRERFDTIY